MKQIAQYQDGRLELQEVPKPTLPPGGVLVRTTHSVVSVGTEKMKVEQAKMNLLQKALARPDQVRIVLNTARNLGWRTALEKVRNRMETPTPLGYSAAGVVLEVDPLNTRLHVGDRVACAGGECAFHAEYLAVPDLLVAKVPHGVENWQAAYTTIASIALQTVRQVAPTLGDQVMVIGQGLVGLLVTNLLAVSGCRVMAVDQAPERRPFCETMGAEKVVILGQQDLADEVRVWTGSYGVDAVVLATGTQSNAPTEQAVDSLRDRGRLVVVGITKVDLPWKVAYEKEIEVRYSRSYGPGRYDPSYEWGGMDYPIGYVRWTEGRNFEACLHLMKTGTLRLEAITTRRLPFRDAIQGYSRLLANGASEVGVLFEYDSAHAGSDLHDASPQRISRDASGAETPARRIPPVSEVHAIGAGNFARTMLLPNLRGRIPFGTVVNHTALSANHVKTKFGFAQAATDVAAVLGPESGQGAGVLIATRHHLHASLVTQALARNHHVFVEKPLCLTREELDRIDAAVAGSKGSVQVGFNRRFAPASVQLRQHLVGVAGPKSASFRVMPGKLDPHSWYANYAESGGRILGEACHYLDYFCFLFSSAPVRVWAQSIWPTEGRLPFPDSIVAQVRFADDSCGQLIYSAEGDPSWPKEILTVFGAGIVAELTNFQKLVVHRKRKAQKYSYQSKGHAEEMEAWAKFLGGQQDQPLPYAASRQSMLLTFAVLESIQQSRPIEL
jgi:predicted dehydrogenase/threonine dehydrogenase-like Zn-dependent dehydrogenase